MDSKFEFKDYQPLLALVQINSIEYSAINKVIAVDRAAFYLSSALELINKSTTTQHCLTINALLIAAADLGSAEAAFHLSQRLLFPSCQVPFSPSSSFILLKLAADRGHHEASYQLACCYAGINDSKLMQSVCEKYFNALSGRQRAHFAEHYFKQGIEGKHRESIEELIIAYAYGRGYIKKNANCFIALCEDLIEKGDQSVALGYGAWLAGMTVEGGEALPEAIKLELDYSKALKMLIQGAKGPDVRMIRHGIYLICLGHDQGLWHFLAPNELSALFIEMMEKGNQVLALYYAWYAIPAARRPAMPSFMVQQKLTHLAAFVQIDENRAMYFLDKVLLGPDRELSTIAKELFLKVFAFHDQHALILIN
jgi:hypothetical protein